MKKFWNFSFKKTKPVVEPIIPVVEVKPIEPKTIKIKPRENMCGYYSAYIYYVQKSEKFKDKYIVKIESSYETFYTYASKEEIIKFCRNNKKIINNFQNPKIGAPVDIKHSVIKTHISANEMMVGLKGIDFNLGQYYPRK